MKADQAARNRFLGGSKPFGFRIVRTAREKGAGLEPDEAEQRAIKSMVSMRKRSKGLRAIRKAIVAKGFAISPVGVANILDAAGVPKRARARE